MGYNFYSICYGYLNGMTNFNLLEMKEAAIILKISPGKKGSMPTVNAFFTPILVTKDNWVIPII